MDSTKTQMTEARRNAALHRRAIAGRGSETSIVVVIAITFYLLWIRRLVNFEQIPGRSEDFPMVAVEWGWQSPGRDQPKPRLEGEQSRVVLMQGCRYRC